MTFLRVKKKLLQKVKKYKINTTLKFLGGGG